MEMLFIFSSAPMSDVGFALIMLPICLAILVVFFGALLFVAFIVFGWILVAGVEVYEYIERQIAKRNKQ